ncbi:GGDEF domain-containing protein [Deinococcus sedimenti]|uniref:GGDEF domain-containing protein n=1 Tax=Deinococcus sedimenti TaxID=1867090 RepID=A0ABQ2S3D1_9DEIO|nr:GGDEF domain-containing protein [Deinococcus sedimenti]GGR93619.1 hypothetical protein GCM10008960_20760 [Deinococcus sedimenti]
MAPSSPPTSGDLDALRQLTRQVAHGALQHDQVAGLLADVAERLAALGGALTPPGQAGVPVTVREQEVARLALPSPDPAVPAALDDLALLLTPLIGLLRGRELARHLAELNNWMVRQDDPQVAFGRVRDLLRDLGAQHVTLVPQPLASPGDGLILPLAGRYRARQALQVQPVPAWTAEEHRTAAAAARQFALLLERVAAENRLETLLHLQRQLGSVAAEALYAPLLDAAVRLVPGAQGGSLLVRQGDSFRFAAVAGYPFAALQDVTFAWQETRDVWYGLGEAAWQGGAPRVLDQVGLHRHGRGYSMDGRRVQDLLPQVLHLQSGLAVPVLVEDDVYALINLDAFDDPAAFDGDATRIAQAFGSMASLLIHEARRRDLMTRLARTDDLTGLGNRRALNEHLAAAAQLTRDGEALSLLVMDLRGFKRINDELGHAAGDEALRQVAELLRRELPGTDLLFRWGGDEFAAILSGTPPDAALQAAQRITGALGALRIGDLPLRANIGVSSLGSGDNAEQLLARADAAMYAARDRGAAVAESASEPAGP